MDDIEIDDMEIVLPETPTSTYPLLHVDVLPSVITAIPASMGQIALLRVQRCVCKDFRDAVDKCLRAKKWMLPFATRAMDFRTDFATTGIVITPPISLIRGITRMLYTGEIAELVAGIREFIADQTTIEIVFAEFRTYVSELGDGDATDKAMRQIRVRIAQQAGMPGTVAWAMRYHMESTSIQCNGSHILTYFDYTPGLPGAVLQADATDENCDMQVYLIGALANVMHDSLHNRQVQQSCLDAMRAITVGMFENDAPLDNALLKPGKHNVLHLIFNAMSTHVDDESLVLAAAYMANVYGHITCNQGYSEHMKTFDVKKAEYTVLIGMRKHYVQAPEIAKQCIMVLQHLVGTYIPQMERLCDAVQYSLNAVQSHTHDAELVHHMQKLVYDIMDKLEGHRHRYTGAQRQHMQDFAANRGAIQLSLSSLAHCLNVAVSSPTADVDSEYTFYILMALCKDNARVKALIVDADAVRILEGMRKVLHKSTFEETLYVKNLDKLKLMLSADEGTSQKLSM